jgi:hypothetical protein
MYRYIDTERQTERNTYRHTYKQAADMHTQSQTDRQEGRQADKKTCKNADRHDRQTGRWSDKWTGRQTDRLKGRRTDRWKEEEKDILETLETIYTVKVKRKSMPLMKIEPASSMMNLELFPFLPLLHINFNRRGNKKNLKIFHFIFQQYTRQTEA